MQVHGIHAQDDARLGHHQRPERPRALRLGERPCLLDAVPELLPLGKLAGRRIEEFVEPGTILVSNTSSYPMTDVSVRMSRPERALVTHWFNPPHIVPVVEVVPGEKTSDETTQTTYDFLDRIGKTPVRLNQEIPGFLVNRVQVAMFREVFDLLDRNIASPEQIDRAIRGSAGMRLAALGPLASCTVSRRRATSPRRMSSSARSFHMG
ncbi:MAG: hypothetical protein IIA68_10875 [Proteobacteria bacterium]|nr:hypothetical protein [Pseudomonadota bacterium]